MSDIVIIVNGKLHSVLRGNISYEQVVALTGKPAAPDYTVVCFWRGMHGGRTLVPGDTVPVNFGLVFNVGRTDNS